MLSGEEPKVHKITWDWDDYKPEKGFITVPTVFSVARAAGLRTVMVVGKKKLQHLAPPGSVDSFVFTERGDGDVANEAIVQAGVGFDLLFVHFPDVDYAGHAEGWMSSAYVAKVAEADAAIGRLLAALPAHTTVILTADHGGKDRSHGQDIPENMTVPWIVAGPKVVRRGEMTARVKQTDTAATALWALGLSLPGSCAGTVVREPFTAPVPSGLPPYFWPQAGRRCSTAPPPAARLSSSGRGFLPSSRAGSTDSRVGSVAVSRVSA